MIDKEPVKIEKIENKICLSKMPTQVEESE